MTSDCVCVCVGGREGGGRGGGDPRAQTGVVSQGCVSVIIHLSLPGAGDIDMPPDSDYIYLFIY